MNSDFDFWIGEWDVRWDGGSGVNVITRELGGTAILERFSSSDLNGMSVSVHTADGWRQTWVDENRTYLDFRGGMNGDSMELYHDPFRMRFTEIRDDSLVWRWERLTDGAWELKWLIEYARRQASGS